MSTRAGCCTFVGSALDTMVTNYTIPKYVTIRSKALRIPQLVLSTIIVLYVIIYKIVFELAFVEGEPIQSTTYLLLTTPQVNFWKCSETLGTCTYDLPNSSDPKYPYCQPQQRPTIISGCLSGELGSTMARPSFSDEIIIPTIVSRAVGVGGHDGKLFATQRIPNSTFYIAGVEDYILFVGHSFRTSFVTHDFNTSRGYIRYSNGIERRLERCADVTCPHFAQDRRAQFLLDTTLYIGIGSILDAAGVELDQWKGQYYMGVYAKDYRNAGVAIELNIHHTNMDPLDFWTWPWGLKPKYTLEPRKQNVSGVFGHVVRDPQSKEYESRRGINILVRNHGSLGRWSMLKGILACTVATTALTFVPMFVSHMLVHLYEKCVHLRHVAKLHRLFYRDISPLDTEISVELLSSIQKENRRRTVSSV